MNNTVKEVEKPLLEEHPADAKFKFRCARERCLSESEF